MGLRRGFKTDANWYARQMRLEQDIEPHAPLCPWKLANHLGCFVVPLSEYSSLEPKAVDYFRSDKGRKEFSAITLPGGHIIHNDYHDLKRQASNLAHELAHAILVHPFVPLKGEFGNRHFEPQMEEEANWLGPALLISDEAAMFIVQQRWSLDLASERYGATKDVIRMRINVTGAATRISRRRTA